MKVILIHRNTFQNRPPLVSLVKTLVSLGVRPTVITGGLNDEFKRIFEKQSIEYHIVPFELAKGKLTELKNYIHSKIWGEKVQKMISQITQSNDVLWIEGNYTFSSLNSSFVNKYHHVMQIQEMFNAPGLKGRIYESRIRKIISSSSAVIVPEYNRAHFYWLNFGLNKLPFVLPNKPAFVPSKEDILALHDKYCQYDHIFEKKVILYQGIISSHRSDYEPILKALKKLDKNNEFTFVFLGRDSEGLVKKYKIMDYNVEHIPFVPAPDYLYFTSKAYIGVVTYQPNCLNNIYCAPNKIYEYSSFGVPMLANNIPGLKYTVEYSGCGKTYTCNSDILPALSFIIDNHDEMSNKALNFFNETEYDTIVKSILETIGL